MIWYLIFGNFSQSGILSEITPPFGADVEILFGYFSPFVSFERTAGKNLVGLRYISLCSPLNEDLVSRGVAD